VLGSGSTNLHIVSLGNLFLGVKANIVRERERINGKTYSATSSNRL
jgi:hypothetical protein